MAINETKKYQINEIADASGNVRVLHPETESDVVKMSNGSNAVGTPVGTNAYNTSSVWGKGANIETALNNLITFIYRNDLNSSKAISDAATAIAMAQNAVDKSEARVKAYVVDENVQVDSTHQQTYIDLNNSLNMDYINYSGNNIPSRVALKQDFEQNYINVADLKTGDIFYLEKTEQGYYDRWVAVDKDEDGNVINLTFYKIDTTIDLQDYLKTSDLTSGNVTSKYAQELATARTITVELTNGVSNKKSSGSVTFKGNGNVSMSIALPDSTVAEGTYSCTHVNAKGIVTGGGQILKIGGTTTPSDLAVGGIWFKEV